jgi:hypothetical protein
LDKPLEAAIIMMVILTTFLAPPLLQLVLDEPEEVATVAETATLPAAD